MRTGGQTVKTLNLPKSSYYLLCLLAAALILAMTPLVATAMTYNVYMIAGDSFSPADITIAVGDTVIWTNQSVNNGGHTVTGDPTGTANGGVGADSTCQETLNSGFMGSVGDMYSHTFTI